MASNVSDDLWRECVAWLTKCKAIPADHKANWPDSEIRVLALTLRDGVILCNLLNSIDPNALDMKDFNRKPQMAQFLCCQNIKLFLDTCKNYYGLRESDLFEPTMLYDLTNFHRVLITLSKLSRRVAQIHPHLPGFSTQVSPSERSNSNEDIYKNLHSTTTENAHCNGHADDQNTKEEEVYHDLCAIQRASRPQLTASTSNYEQRDFVIRELIDTESNYFDVLQALKFKFMQPMEKLLSRDELKTIYPKIKELAEIHEKFLERLKDAISVNSKNKLSQVFLDFREPFLIYGDYCSSMTKATDTLIEVCKRNPQVEQCMEQSQKEHSGGKNQLRDILSVPMQRILKYHLLLGKLVEETSLTHEDYRGLERAKEAMVDVAQYINEVKRDSEHLDIIQKIRDRIFDLNLPNGNDLRQYGRFLLDGELSIKSHEDQKTKHRYAFIFEKIMILVKASKLGENGLYSFLDAYNLCDYRVESSFGRRTLGRDNRFTLLLARKTQSTAFTLYMKTEAERDKWLNALQNAMDNLEPIGCRSTDHKFQLTTFETPSGATMCRHCSKFLKGLIHQGYKCKVCEIAVHKGCISSTGRCKQETLGLAPPVCDRQLSEFYWFVGPMSRDTASARLENRKVGTYLLRVRPQGASNPNETMYALSLKTDEHTIKHMKINQKMEKNNTLYYLSSRRLFKTIIELVSFYERNDLGENFAGLNQSLSWPFREVVATALYDFSPREPNQLPLRQGCQVLVIGKEGDSKGWWRGKTMERVGFFPKEYVREYPQPSEEL
ncbi:protein vav isoform X2 [Sitodiplosis mosellana]|uniref:protein vav isoform X2 n=1 Tax=Sitodiplosis mosellana TaxID=263140 RepID=UPI00244395CA|nr:protein vav isoform X2 [Sitodiplosis mosellana]